MAEGPKRRFIYLFAGIIAAYLVAEVVSDAILIVFHLTGPTGMIAGMVVFAVVFFAVIGALQKYAGVAFFGRYDD